MHRVTCQVLWPLLISPKRIHAIRTQTEPYVSRIQIKFRVRSIYFSPLWPISGVSQHRLFLAFLFVPSHQLSILFISKQMLQMWYYRRVPHDLGRNSLPGMLPLDVPRIIFSNFSNLASPFGPIFCVLILPFIPHLSPVVTMRQNISKNVQIPVKMQHAPKSRTKSKMVKFGCQVAG